MNKKFDFDDINLIPKYSVVDSRSQCDTSIKFGNYTFKNPIIPANMESVINEEIAINLAKSGYFYIMHRFGVDNKKFIQTMKTKGLIASISVGVNSDSYEFLESLVGSNYLPDYICIDIAHGHCKKMKKILKFIKETHKETFKDVFVISGNVSSIEAAVDLDKWGADAIKVGIGPGCFIAGSKILTSEGFKNIEDVKKGDFVLTHRNEFKEVISTISHMEEDDLINVNGLVSTKKHEYYVINKKDKYDVNIDNYQKYAYWLEAINLDKDQHLILKLNENNLTVVDIVTKNNVRNDRGMVVYDLSVFSDKSYTVNNIIVHNSACTTYPTTGFGSRGIQASVVNECANVSRKPIIADGGIKSPADITKSIVMGASMVMVGGLLSSFIDSPGRTVEQNGKIYKEFYGSASSKQSNKNSRIEGTVKLNLIKNTTLLDYMDYITECLQSSISYGGGSKIDDLFAVKWI